MKFNENCPRNEELVAPLHFTKPVCQAVVLGFNQKDTKT